MTESNYILSITKQQLSALPAAKFEGPIEVINSEEEVRKAVSELRGSNIIGFDTETRPSFKRGHLNTVSLMQLSTRDKCFLFRLNHLNGVPSDVVELLEDENYLKVGLSIHDDFHNLERICELHPQGFVDLQNFVRDYRIADSSLTRIYGIVFGERISKGQRLTNWEAETLTVSQQGYAALDAVACVRIYDYLAGGNFSPCDSEYRQIPEQQGPAEE